METALGFAKQPEPETNYGSILRAAQKNKLTMTRYDGVRFSQDEYLRDMLIITVEGQLVPVQHVKAVPCIESPTHLALIVKAIKENG